MENKKPSEADKIESANLMEEAKDIFDSCIQCGMCKAICPVFKVLKEERVSAPSFLVFMKIGEVKSLTRCSPRIC